jgi:hypothetical protein
MLAIDPSGQNLYAIDQNNSTTNMMIYRVPTSGAPAQVFASGLNWVVGVTVDSSNVYWLSTGDNTVYAQPVSGGKPRALATGQYFPSDIAVLDSSTVYWGACDSTGSTCDAWQMPVSGGSPTEVASAEPEGIAVASPNLFLAFPVGAGIIQSFPINSGGANVEFDSGNLFYGVAASPLYVAWYGVSTGSSGNNGVVRAMPSASLGVTGSTPTTLAVGQAPVSIALDSSYVYWANTGGSQAFNGSIVKAPLGGGSPTTLVSGVDPASIVVDAKYVYWLGSDGAASGVFRTPK